MAEKKSKTTTDHDTIRKWAEDRGGVPATIQQTEDGGEIGVLRIHFPGQSGEEEQFDKLSWDEFFDKFDENDLAFLYQDETKEGGKSRFFRFVKRDNQ